MGHVELAEDKFAWLRDDEFARQAIAGVNPVNIERLKVFPPVSNLDPDVYGPLESSLKEEHILGQINGMTVQQVNYHVKMLTYHSDIFSLKQELTTTFSNPNIISLQIALIVTGIG